MSNPDARLILAVNSGSSSLKLGVFVCGDPLANWASLQVDGIGTDTACVRYCRSGESPETEDIASPDHDAAIRTAISWLQRKQISFGLAGVGHRIVHGGQKYAVNGYLIDDAMQAELNEIVSLAPEHMPQAMAAIQLFRESFPDIPHVACFDTAFHHTMPPLARQYPLPELPHTRDVIRFGFHGLSCESVMAHLRLIDPRAADGKIVVAHLGNGASMTAIRSGQSVDTTMGFSPTGGLMMGTRTGDLDPGALLYLLTHGYARPESLAELVNRQSGLKGVSGSTSDMATLLEQSARDTRAANAIALYCYLARKQLGGLVTVLSGLDTLIFTGGIGEHAPAIRAAICDDLNFLGVAIDSKRNVENGAVVSADNSEVVVRVIPTDEERIIAHHTYATIGGKAHGISL